MVIIKLLKVKKVAARFFFPSFCTLFFTLSSCVAQRSISQSTGEDKGLLIGKIYVKKNNIQLPFGKVYIEKLKDTVLIGGDGNYKCSLPKGRYKIIGSSLGFEEQKKKIMIKGKDTVQVDFYLSEKEELLHK